MPSILVRSSGVVPPSITCAYTGKPSSRFWVKRDRLRPSRLVSGGRGRRGLLPTRVLGGRRSGGGYSLQRDPIRAQDGTSFLVAPRLTRAVVIELDAVTVGIVEVHGHSRAVV